MRKSAAAMLAAVVLVLLSAGIARAGTASFTGSIAATSPKHNPGMLSGCQSIAGAWAYAAHTFTVTENGSYSFTDKTTGFNPFIGLYSGSFNPALVAGTGSNCMATGRDSFTVTLATGTNYILVVEPTNIGATGAYTIEGSGPGSINIQAAPAAPAATSVPQGFVPAPEGSGCNAECSNINIPFGYHLVSLFHGSDDTGKAALDIYCVNEEGGRWGGEVSQADLMPFTTPPNFATFVKKIDACSVPVNVYMLTTGEVDVNIGPIPESKVIAVIFRGLPPVDVHFIVFEPLLGVE